MCSNLVIKLIVIMCVAAAESTNTRLEFSIQPASSTVEAAVVTSLTARNAIHCAANARAFNPAAVRPSPSCRRRSSVCCLPSGEPTFATAASRETVHRRRLQSRAARSC
uniref:Secreted protein n=1 Tax=Macrostomum lignano TaxID=282301 RepID=A0A1I8FLY1_9PLAT